MAKIGIVTVLYRSESVLRDFFKSLDKQTYKEFILYVIDNNSPDNSLKLSKELKQQVNFETKIIENSENYGIAKGNNIGIIQALADGCQYILLSNNDIKLETHAIEKLLIGMEQEKMNLAVPKIYFYGTNLIWAAGGKFKYISGGTAHIGYHKEDCLKWNQRYKVNYSPTCFMLIRSNIFHNIGLMDEAYFVYYDDTDFIYRCRKQKERIIYIPESIIHHKESTCTGGTKSDFTLYYNARNAVYFALKNFTLFHCCITAIAYFIYYWFIRRYNVLPQQRKLIKKGYKDGYKMYKKLYK